MLQKNQSHFSVFLHDKGIMQIMQVKGQIGGFKKILDNIFVKNNKKKFHKSDCI